MNDGISSLTIRDTTSIYALYLIGILLIIIPSSHAIHRMLAVYALGADSAIIEAGYATDSSYLKETCVSPNLITAENVKEHLGDRT